VRRRGRALVRPGAGLEAADPLEGRDGLVVWLAGAIGIVGIAAMLAIDLVMTQAV